MKLLFYVGVVIALLSVSSIFMRPSMAHFWINTTPSEPMGIYRLAPLSGHLQTTNSLYLITPPASLSTYMDQRGWVGAGRPLIKGIGAIAGDMVCVSQDGIYINGRFRGPVASVDSQRRALPRLRGCFALHPGYFLPFSSYARKSFDGRYFGPLQTDTIRGRLVPIWTF